jgi:hypothetical protein
MCGYEKSCNEGVELRKKAGRLESLSPVPGVATRQAMAAALWGMCVQSGRWPSTCGRSCAATGVLLVGLFLEWSKHACQHAYHHTSLCVDTQVVVCADGLGCHVSTPVWLLSHPFRAVL